MARQVAMHNTLTQRRTVVRFPSIAALTALLILSLVFRQHIADQLHSWHLLPEPERLTELYFTAPNSLSTTYVAGTPQTVSFTVHNLEAQDMTYRYAVIETGDDATKSADLATGSFALTPSSYNTLNLTVTPMDMGPHATITVKLLNTNEVIEYHVRRPA
jgi:hypothetical protein